MLIIFFSKVTNTIMARTNFRVIGALAHQWLRVNVEMMLLLEPEIHSGLLLSLPQLNIDYIAKSI